MTNELRTYLTEQVNALKTHLRAVQKPKQFAKNGWQPPVLKMRKLQPKSCLPKLKQTLCLLTV